MQIALQKALSKDLNQIPLQPVSYNTWQRKYRAVDFDGNPVDETPRDTLARVAHALAQQEAPEKRQFWYNRFLWAFDQGALPAGRILSNAGAEQYKPNTSTINCTVSRAIRDSMSGILDGLHESGRTLRAGCGIGFEFSTLRPKGAFVNGAGSETSGPLPFMDVYDKLCFTIASAGGRRGAQMATFDCSHPDIFEFIKAKREDGRLRQFNCSVLITEDFMEAVNEDADWKLVFPAHPSEMNKHDIVWRFWPTVESFYTVNEKGRVACRVYKTVKARALFDEIMRSNYEFAEPGFLLIDMINEMNNNWFCEDIRATNP